MRSATLYDCFDRHLSNLDILTEGNELFVAKVVEDFILNLSGLGFTMGSQAEDIYSELSGEVTQMLRKKIYGFYCVDSYRDFLREVSSPEPTLFYPEITEPPQGDSSNS